MNVHHSICAVRLTDSKWALAFVQAGAISYLVGVYRSETAALAAIPDVERRITAGAATLLHVTAALAELLPLGDSGKPGLPPTLAAAVALRLSADKT
jgi:hypothetical protein